MDEQNRPLSPTPAEGESVSETDLTPAAADELTAPEVETPQAPAGEASEAEVGEGAPSQASEEPTEGAAAAQVGTEGKQPQADEAEPEEPEAAEPEEAVEVVEGAVAEDVAEGEADAEAEPEPPSEATLLCGLQCVLFVAGEPLPVDRLAQALGQEVTDIPRLCDKLNDLLVDQGLHVVQLAGGFALATRPEYADYVQRLVEPEPERLSIQALETLAIVAYRQPITRPEIDSLRGVNSGGVVASLLEKGLLRIKGRKDAPGRPFMLETTPHFLSSFGLKDLADLPRVDLPEIGQAVDQPKVLGEALEELTGSQEGDEPSEE